MATFQYTALDARGQQTNGTLEAATDADAAQILRDHGLYPTALSEYAGQPAAQPAVAQPAVAQPAAAAAATVAMAQPAAAAMPAGAKGKAKPKAKAKAKAVTGKKIQPKVLMIHTRQLATLIDSGLPLLRSLDVLGKQEPNPALKGTIKSIADAVQSGSTYSEALGQHPKIFNKLFINMVKAGELGGVLELVLDRLAEYMEKADKLKNKIMAAATYPIIVLIMAGLILTFLMVVIVPQFTAMFEDMDTKLNPFSQFVFSTSDFLIKPEAAMLPPIPNVLFVLIAIVGVVIGFNVWKATPGGKKTFDALLLKVPVIGDVNLKSSVSRFTRTLGTLVTSGVPILQALNITRETTGNVIISEAIGKIHDSVKEGETVTQPMQSTGVFPDMVVSMVDVGEETGQLPDMLLKISDVYEDEVDNGVTAMTAIIEPLMIVFLALIVGSIVIALFLPMIQIIQTMQQ